MPRATDSDIPRLIDEAGRVRFAGEVASELLLRGYDITGLKFEPSAEIEHYNAWCDKLDKADYRLHVVNPADDLPGDTETRLATWSLGESYRELPVRETLLKRCKTSVERDRVEIEMDLFESRGWLPILRLMFMLVDHFRNNKIIWGVGRGSSVASYCLYLIGVHRINSLRYGLDIHEFLRES